VRAIVRYCTDSCPANPPPGTCLEDASLGTLHIIVIHCHHLNDSGFNFDRSDVRFLDVHSLQEYSTHQAKSLVQQLELLWFFLPALPSIARSYINLPSFVFLLVLPFLRHLVSHTGIELFLQSPK
jgi:hypothetical protein